MIDLTKDNSHQEAQGGGSVGLLAVMFYIATVAVLTIAALFCGSNIIKG